MSEPPRLPPSKRLTPLSGELQPRDPLPGSGYRSGWAHRRERRQLRVAERMRRHPLLGPLLYIGVRLVIWLLVFNAVASVRHLRALSLRWRARAGRSIRAARAGPSLDGSEAQTQLRAARVGEADA